MLVTEQTFAAEAQALEKQPVLDLDLETDGLTPWNGNRLCGVAVNGRYFPFRHKGGGNLSLTLLPKLLAAILPRQDRTFGGWTLRFDMTFLSYEPGGERFLSRGTVMVDGIIDALLLNENEPTFRLEAIAKKYLGAAATKSDMDALLQRRFPKFRRKKELKGKIWELPASDVASYAAGDTDLPRRLREKYDPAITAWGLDTIRREMNDYSLLLGRMQKGGLRINVDLCRQLSVSTAQRQQQKLVEIQRLLGPVNPGSPPQVCRALGTGDARETTLARLTHPAAALIIAYKKLGKAKSTYYDPILEQIDAQGYIHPQLNLNPDPRDRGGTRSGRLSCSNPPFQGLPRVDDDPDAIYRVRDLVIPRDGCSLVKLDYERAEMWMAGSICQEGAIVDAYNSGRDIYQEMATSLGLTRHQAKVLFLMIQYGAGAWKIAQTFGWPFRTRDRFPAGQAGWDLYNQQKAAQVKKGFHTLYPNIQRAMKFYAQQFESTGCLRLWTGRAVHYNPDTTPSYAGWNRKIQGAVAEMIRHAMLRLEPVLERYDARMILQVHDELLIECPDAALPDVVPASVYAMTEFDQFLLKPRVEPKVGKDYANMRSYPS